MDGVWSVNWGTDYKEGIKAFIPGYRDGCAGVRAWGHRSGILGASLDGLVCTTAVLEVKCTYGARDLTIEESVKKKDFSSMDRWFYSLSENHLYWHQGQHMRLRCVDNQSLQQHPAWQPLTLILLLLLSGPVFREGNGPQIFHSSYVHTHFPEKVILHTSRVANISMGRLGILLKNRHKSYLTVDLCWIHKPHLGLWAYFC